MGFSLRARPALNAAVRPPAALRDERAVIEADRADAALSLAIAQARYHRAIAGGDARTLADATTELMRARTRIEALRRAAIPGLRATG